MKKIIKISFLILYFLLQSACTRIPELEAPCHAFGRYCVQAPINEIQFCERKGKSHEKTLRICA